MPDLRLIGIWKKLRRVGVLFYIFGCTSLIPIACLITKELAEYISTGVLFRHFEGQVYSGLILIGLLSIFIGIYSWVNNERRYERLMKSGESVSKE